MSRRTPKRTASPLGEKRPSARWSSDRRALRESRCMLPVLYRARATASGVQHRCWPVNIPCLFNEAAISASSFPSRKRDRMIATAFGEVVRASIPGRGTSSSVTAPVCHKIRTCVRSSGTEIGERVTSRTNIRSRFLRSAFVVVFAFQTRLKSRDSVRMRARSSSDRSSFSRLFTSSRSRSSSSISRSFSFHSHSRVRATTRLSGSTPL